MSKYEFLSAKEFESEGYVSHNNSCFPCNLAITNFLVSHACKIIFHDDIDRTVRMFTS